MHTYTNTVSRRGDLGQVGNREDDALFKERREEGRFNGGRNVLFACL